MTSISWKKGVNGDWSNAANWSNGNVPQSGDTVTIADAGTYTLTVTQAEAAGSVLLNAEGADLLDSSTLSLGTSLTVSAGTLSLASGNVTGGTVGIASGAYLLSSGSAAISSALDNSGSINISSGTLSLEGGGSLAGSLSGAGTLLLADGVFTTGTGSLTSTGHLAIDGGTLAGPGTISVLGTTTIVDAGGAAAVFLGDDVIWLNKGTVNDGGLIYLNTSWSADTVSITNAAGASFNLTTDDARLAFYNTGGIDVFTNAGTLAKTGGTLTSNLALSLSNTGLIKVASGIIELDGGGSLTGSLSGAGTLLLANGTFTTGTGSLTSTGHLAIDGGTLAGPGTISILGTTTIVDAGGAAAAFLGGDVTWLNKGIVNDGGLIYLNTSSPPDTVTITNAAGASFNLTADDARIAFYNGGGIDTFTNAGTLAKTGGTLTSNLDMAVNNTGLVNVASGTLELDGGGSLGGTVSGAGTLALGGGTFTSNGGTLLGTGNLAIYGDADLAIASGKTLTLSDALSFGNANGYSPGFLTGPGTLTTTGTTTINSYSSYPGAELGGGITWVNSGTVNDAANIYINTSNPDTVTIVNEAGANFDLTSGYSYLYQNGAGNDLFTNAGTIAATSGAAGTIATIGITLNNTGLINVASGATLDLGGGGSLGGTVSGAGTLALGGGTFTSNGGTLLGTGNLAIYGDADLAISSGKTLTLSDALSFGIANGYSPGFLTGPGTLTTTGTTTINSYSSYPGAELGGRITWVNSGTVNDAAYIYINTVSSDTVTIVNEAGANFDLTSGYSYLYQNGAGNDLFTNAGTIAATSGAAGTIATIGITLNNTGLISVASSATLDLDGGGSLGGTLGGAGTLALGVGAFTSTVAILQGATNLAINGGSTLTVSGASGTLSTVLAVNGDGTLGIASGTDLTLSSPLSFGIANGYSPGFLTGPGTLTTTGTTTINSYSSYPGAELGGGITWVNSGTVNDAAYIYTNTVSSDTVTIVNQAGANFDLTSGYSYLYQNGAGNDLFTNAGTIAATSGAAGTIATIGITLNNTGLISVASGATLDLDGGGSLGGTLGGAGTLALGGGAFTSTLAILKGATNLAVNGGSTLTVSGASGTLSTALAVNGDGTLGIASGTDLTLSSPLSFGIANGYSPGFLTGPGTLTTTGTTTINSYSSYPGAELGGSITWVNSGTVNDAANIYINTSNPDTVTIVNQAGAHFDLTSGYSYLYQNGVGNDVFTNAGTLAATSGVAGTIATIGIAVNNTGLISAMAGTLALQSSVNNTGKLLATGGGVLSLASATFLNLPGTTLTGGSYEADAASIIELSNNAIITADSARITLSGVGSAIEALNTTTNTQVTLESTLATISASGTLALLNGRNFTSSANNGTFTTSGLLSLGGITFSAAELAINHGTVSGYGTLSGTIADAGLIIASGGTLLIEGAVSGKGVLSAAAGAVINLTEGGALSGTVSGNGTLQLDGTTPYTLAGATVAIADEIIDAGATLSGTGTLTGSAANPLAGVITDHGLIDANGGTLSVTGLTGISGGVWSGGGLEADANSTLLLAENADITTDAGSITLSGTASAISWASSSVATLVSLESSLSSITAAGTLSILNGRNYIVTAAGGTFTVAGALVLGDGAFGASSLVLDAGATISGTGTISASTVVAGAATVVSGSIALAGALSGSSTLSIGAAAEVDLITGSGFSGTLADAGTLLLTGASFVSATVSIASTGSLSGFGTLGTVTNSGWLDANDGTLTVKALTSLTNGTLTQGQLEADTGSVLQLAANTAISTLLGSVTLSGLGSAIQAFNTAASAEVELDSTLGSIGSTGALTVSNGRTFVATSDAGTITNSGLLSIQEGSFSATDLIITASGTLIDDGSFTGDITNQGTVAIADEVVLTLIGGGVLGGTFSGLGTLQLSGKSTYTTSPTTLLDAGLVSIAAGSTLSGAGTIVSQLDNAGTVVASSGTLTIDGGFAPDEPSTGVVSIAAGAVLDLADGGVFVGSIKGAGSLVNADAISNGVALAGTGTISVLNLSGGEIYQGKGDSLVISGTSNMVNNAGGIGGYRHGIVLSGSSNSIINSGLITGDFGAAILARGNGTTTIVNTGVIADYEAPGVAAVSLNGATSATLTNAGTIIGGYYLTSGQSAVQFGPGANRLIIDPGAAFIGTVRGGTGSNTIELAAASGAVGTLAGLGTAFQRFSVVTEDAGANWQLTDSNTISSGSTLNTGGNLNLTGTLAAAGGATISGAGSVTVSAGGGLEVSGATGSVNVLGVGLNNQGLLDVSGSRTLSLAGAQLANLTNGTLTGGNFEVNGASTLLLATGAAVTTDDANVVLTGAGGKIAWLNGAGGTLVTLAQSLASIGAIGTLDLQGSSFTASFALANAGQISLAAGTLTTSSLTIASTGTVSGTGTVAGSIADQGLVTANGGTLSLTGSVSGAGTVGIGQDSTLVASGSLSAANVTFLSSGGILDLGLPASMTGSIEDFATTDTIDLLRTVVKVQSFVNDTLTLTGASGTFALHFSGDYSGYKFAAFSDGHGGTEILLT